MTEVYTVIKSSQCIVIKTAINGSCMEGDDGYEVSFIWPA